MRLHYDKATDAIYLSIDDRPIVKSEEVHPGIVLDFDDQGDVVAIEVLRSRVRANVTQVSGARIDATTTSESLANDLRLLRDRLHASGVEPMTVEEFDCELAEMRGE